MRAKHTCESFLDHKGGHELSCLIFENQNRHTFWAHATGTQDDLIFNVWVEPQDLAHGFDEAMMRNFRGYLNDCDKQGLAPSLFQLLLFLYDADIVLTPPFWLPISLLVGLHHVVAYWIGAVLLG